MCVLTSPRLTSCLVSLRCLADKIFSIRKYQLINKEIEHDRSNFYRVGRCGYWAFGVCVLHFCRGQCEKAAGQQSSEGGHAKIANSRGATHQPNQDCRQSFVGTIFCQIWRKDGGGDDRWLGHKHASGRYGITVVADVCLSGGGE